LLRVEFKMLDFMF